MKANQEPGQDSVVPGRKPVLELLDAAPERVDTVFLQKGAHGPEISQIVEFCKRARVRFRIVERVELERLFPGNTQGVAARVREVGYASFEELLRTALDAPLPLLLALDQVQDPGNVGALARTLYALGGAGLVVPQDRTAFLGGAAAKASAGALTRLPVARVVNLARALDQALDQGWNVYATVADPGAVPLFDAPLYTPAVLVLGNEEKGVRPGVQKRATGCVTIPMARPFDSLNVAQAGAIILGEFTRRRWTRGGQGGGA